MIDFSIMSTTMCSMPARRSFGPRTGAGGSVTTPVLGGVGFDGCVAGGGSVPFVSVGMPSDGPAPPDEPQPTMPRPPSPSRALRRLTSFIFAPARYLLACALCTSAHLAMRFRDESERDLNVRECARTMRSGVLSLFLLTACAQRPAETTPAPPPADLELVESVPLETSLDNADIPDAPNVWREMLEGARRSIDFASFYASEKEDGESALTPIIQSLVKASQRGVAVRFLVDAKFASKYPVTLALFERVGVKVHRIDESVRAGGVMHAKYFVVDGDDGFVGSQNFDWRSLAHISELGVRVKSPIAGGALEDLFETDWRLAEGAPSNTRIRARSTANAIPVRTGERLTIVASPKDWLPDESEWELPRLVAMLDGAKTHVDLQVLTYKTKERSGATFTILDDAVRRAAARGVKVRLLISHWGANDRSLIGLAKVVEIRVLTIPPWSGGKIEFARVAHAKYLVVDDAAWVGSSNWEGDYFTKTRNVGVVIEGGPTPTRLASLFARNWASPYVTEYASGAPPSGSDPAPP